MYIAMAPYARSTLPYPRKGIQATIEEANYIVIQYRQTGFKDEIVDWRRDHDPVYQLDYRGIPLLEVYAPGQDQD